MLSPTPTKFRSRYTGAEIDSLLTSITNKIDASFIVNNFDGGENLVASAELAQILYKESQRFSDPNYIRSLILSIPQAVIVTQSDLDKLNRLAGAFQGSYADAPTRNTTVNTGSFRGGELTFLVNDGTGIQELSYWNASQLTWSKAKFIPSPNTDPVTSTAGGTVVGITLDLNRYKTAKYIVKAETATEMVVFELLLCIKGSNTMWTTYGYVGNNMNIARVLNCTFSVTDLTVNLSVSPNVSFSFSKIMEM
jgi:hypothetical protein